MHPNMMTTGRLTAGCHASPLGATVLLLELSGYHRGGGLDPGSLRMTHISLHPAASTDTRHAKLGEQLVPLLTAHHLWDEKHGSDGALTIQARFWCEDRASKQTNIVIEVITPGGTVLEQLLVSPTWGDEDHHVALYPILKALIKADGKWWPGMTDEDRA